jgi:hypothetical protein
MIHSILGFMSNLYQHRTVRQYWVRLGLSHASSVQLNRPKPSWLLINGIVIHGGQRRVLISPP